SSCHRLSLMEIPVVSDARTRFKVSSNWTFIPSEPGLGSTPLGPCGIYPRPRIAPRQPSRFWGRFLTVTIAGLFTVLGICPKPNHPARSSEVPVGWPGARRLDLTGGAEA